MNIFYAADSGCKPLKCTDPDSLRTKNLYIKPVVGYSALGPKDKCTFILGILLCPLLASNYHVLPTATAK